ncbi:hypothetical protein HYFRA_00003845 [Hymenoscyphus fraxineus]|uniref:Uncharacterized protein n=1 Tax=Hymenoscyphus fraxineus TaxID=746836 RepID=A0A9N9L2E2_9HELO|nr:hypothetical protein HYFRA_00003845 [Hymenoscyphus fraxineus]
MNLLSTILLFATLAAAQGGPFVPGPTTGGLPPGAEVDPCAKTSYEWAVSGSGGWTCAGGLNYKGKCVYYLFTTVAPYWITNDED